MRDFPHPFATLRISCATLRLSCATSRMRARLLAIHARLPPFVRDFPPFVRDFSPVVRDCPPPFRASATLAPDIAHCRRYSTPFGATHRLARTPPHLPA